MKDYPAKENFGLVFEGEIDVPADGVYRFSVRADDAAALAIDGETVVHNEDYEQPRTGQVPLQHGTHKLRVSYMQRGGDADLRLQWAPLNGTFKDLSAAELRH